MSTQPINKEESHVMSVLVENELGVLARIAGLFAARSFNIDSLTVGPTHDETVSRMTIVVKGNPTVIDQVRKQLNKLVEVIAVQDLTDAGEYVARELMLIKVNCTEGNRVEILNIAELFKAKAIDYTPTAVTFELTGAPEKLDNFITFMQPYTITEIGRSGVVAMNRGQGGLQSEFLEKAEAKG
ncbi:acetolactate synthase small subunit [soil metagenome]